MKGNVGQSALPYLAARADCIDNRISKLTGNVFPGARTIGIDLGQGVSRDNTLLEATGAYSISIRGARESESVCRDNQTIAGATECAATDNVESLWHM